MRSAATVGAATLLSRILGLLRDIVLAAVLGASVSADAFFAAFRLPNFLRRMFAEGSLTSAFIPVFTEVHVRDGKEAAFRLAARTLNWLLIILLAVSAAGVVLAPNIVALLTPGWLEDAHKYSLTVTLTRIMFPYILMISLVALAMGILNAMKHFAAPALAPTVLNITLIITALWASRSMKEPALGIAVGVLLGGLVQIALQIPPLWRRGFRYQSGLAPSDPHLRRVGALFVPSLIGSAVYQVNMIVITVLASFLPHGSLSYLYYADRLVQFPLGIFAIAVATVALPSMSRHAADGDLQALGQTMGYAFRQVTLIMIPAAVGLIVLREPILSLLFQRGRFGPEATQMSAQALFAYSVGLWFIAEIRIVAPAFYAIKNTFTPMMVALASVVINVLLSMLLMQPLGHAGLALAVSLASIFQLSGLLWELRSHPGRIDWHYLFGPMPKVLMASTVTGLLCWAIVKGAAWTGDSPFLETAGVVFAGIGAGVLSYAISLHILKVREFRDLAKSAISRMRARGS